MTKKRRMDIAKVLSKKRMDIGNARRRCTLPKQEVDGYCKSIE